jgi:acetyl-CoA carboxylase carboxyltransferase component
MEELVREILRQEAELAEQVRPEAIERQHAKGRMTARERIARLIDPDSTFFELEAWAGWRMYDSWGGAPAAGVVCGVASVSGRRFMVIANDATVKAGAFFPMTVKKVLRCQRIALRCRLPLIYLVDSSGVFLPLQDEIFPDEDDFGRIFRNNAVLSAAGVPQFAAIMGNCVAGGGYLPVLCDKLLMTEGSGLYLAGPALVKSAIGQDVSHEELGGAAMHARISGTIDFREPGDEACLERLRRLASLLPADEPVPLTLPSPSGRGVGVRVASVRERPSGQADGAESVRPHPFTRVAPGPPGRAAEDVYEIVGASEREEYDVRDVIAGLVDSEEFDEYKAEYGRTMVCGYARIGGFPVALVANQRHRVKPPDGPLQFGGVLYVDSADKTARFVMDANQSWLPLIFLQNVNGFMVGRDAEQEGIIRAGAKLVNVIANSRVPKITVITGGSYGAGNYALCGKAFDPHFLFAWPTARIAVMGSHQAAGTLLDVTIAALRREGKEPDAEELEQLRAKITSGYEEQTDVRYAAARGWLDKIIDPAHTRESLILALECATRHVEEAPFRTGVLQV